MFVLLLAIALLSFLSFVFLVSVAVILWFYKKDANPDSKNGKDEEKIKDEKK